MSKPKTKPETKLDSEPETKPETTEEEGETMLISNEKWLRVHESEKATMDDFADINDWLRKQKDKY